MNMVAAEEQWVRLSKGKCSEEQREEIEKGKKQADNTPCESCRKVVVKSRTEPRKGKFLKPGARCRNLIPSLGRAVHMLPVKADAVTALGGILGW